MTDRTSPAARFDTELATLASDWSVVNHTEREMSDTDAIRFGRSLARCFDQFERGTRVVVDCPMTDAETFLMGVAAELGFAVPGLRLRSL